MILEQIHNAYVHRIRVTPQTNHNPIDSVFANTEKDLMIRNMKLGVLSVNVVKLTVNAIIFVKIYIKFHHLKVNIK